MRYDIVLWDLDATLLDFKYSERKALVHAFASFGLCASEEMITRYSALNEAFWKRLEKGEVTKAFLLRERFVVLFEEYAVTGVPIEEFAKVYRNGLSTFIRCEEGALEVLQTLHGKVRQFLVTNGVRETQEKKADVSGIGKYMEDIFISENMGADKPRKQFFDACFAVIGPAEPSRVLIVGDSLSSDIAGGKNAGIHTCWYHKPEEENNGAGTKEMKTADTETGTAQKPDYEIEKLTEIYDILG